MKNVCYIILTASIIIFACLNSDIIRSGCTHVLVRRALYDRHRLYALALARTLFAGVDAGVQPLRRIGIRAAGSSLRSLRRAQPRRKRNVACLRAARPRFTDSSRNRSPDESVVIRIDRIAITIWNRICADRLMY